MKLSFAAVILPMLCLTSMALGFICPADEGTTFHPDVSTNCQVYHVCFGSELRTMHCPTGYAFDHKTSHCSKASLVNCSGVPEERGLVHSVSIEKLKASALETVRLLRGVLENAVQEVAPTIYNEVQKNYVPVLRRMKEDFLPLIKKMVLPRIQKAYAYMRNIAGRVFRKVHQSWVLSNSTHLNVVSFSDVVSDITKDLQPLLKLAKQMSGMLSRQMRFKRSTRSLVSSIHTSKSNVRTRGTLTRTSGSRIYTSGSYGRFPESYTYTAGSPVQTNGSILDMVIGYVRPFAQNIFGYLSHVVPAHESPLTNQLIIPVLTEMLQDPEARQQLQTVFWYAKSVFTPWMYQMLSGSAYNPDAQASLREAQVKFYTESKPILEKMMEKHLRMILLRTADHWELVMETLEQVDKYSEERVDRIKLSLFQFKLKYGEYFIARDPEQFTDELMHSIQEDLTPIIVDAVHVFFDYMDHHPTAFWNIIFNAGKLFFDYV